MWHEHYPDFIRAGSTLITAVAGVWLGAKLALRGYFRQKEYELVKERYLGAVDVLAAETEQALEIFRHNWTRCLNIYKAFRDEGDAFDPKELSLGFREFEMILHRIPNHRVGDLVASQTIWKVYQFMLAFVANANSKMTKEMTETIRLKLKGQLVTASPESIVRETLEGLHSLDAESHRFAHLTRTLHRLGQILEQERLTFRNATRFHRRQDVQTLLVELEREFISDLENNGDSLHQR